jgi:hypothetical protein
LVEKHVCNSTHGPDRVCGSAGGRAGFAVVAPVEAVFCIFS